MANSFRKKKTPAVFFDRDGVLNYDHGYVYLYTKFKWMKGSIRALKFLTDKKYLIFIITNQSGIGRGYYAVSDFKKLNSKINKFLKQKKIKIHGIEFCPHHPSKGKGKYKINCQCRKPNNGMIKRIKKNWNIDMEKSFMIGDRISDKKCAKKSKLKFFYRKDNLYYQIKEIIKRVS